MKKYLAAFAVFFLLSILVTLHHETRADHATSDGTNQGLSVSTNNAPQAENNSPRPANKRERWWDFAFLYFGWPNGTTIWALVITFVVIAEQTQSSGAQLAFQKETLRPRLKVSKFVNDVLHEAVQDGDWVIVNMKIVNSGGLPAYGVIADTWIEFLWGQSYKFSSGARYSRAALRLNVHTGEPTGFELPLGRRLTDEERYAMGHAKGTVCFRVKLTYQALGKEAHTDEAWSVGLGGMRSIAEYSSET